MTFPKTTWADGDIWNAAAVNDLEQRASAASARALVPTAVKTGTYAAVAGDLIPADISGGSFTITLPTAPADGTRIGCKLVAVDGSHANALTVARGGADVFNVAGGSTTLTLSALFQGVLLQYKASGAIWYVSTADTPLGQPNGAVQADAAGLVPLAKLPTSVVSARSATVNQIPRADGAGGVGWGAQMNDTGKVLYSTTYNPGDVVLYNGERVLITSVVTTGAGVNGLGQPFLSASNYSKLTALGFFFASDYGVKADGTTDDWAALQDLLILVRSLTTNSNNGYAIILPSGQIMLSKTLIVPTQTLLIGQGLYSTTLKLLAGSNCDAVQPEQFNSSSQAALLTTRQATLTAGNLRNAFRWGLRDLTVHGNSGAQAAGDYHHGLNAQTNPLTTTTGTDPDFDPAANVSNVQFRSCTGDGFFSNGRSAMRLANCIAWFNLGNGFTPSFDTHITACEAGFNGMAGFDLNHGSIQGAANKSFNNGQLVPPWITGQNWAQGARTIFGGVVYAAINALTADAASPDTDPTNWQVVTTTNAAAWGVGCYFDSNTKEITFNCDCQQNSASNWYFKTVTSRGIQVTGCSDEPNFNNFGAAWGTVSTVLASNPNNYAGLVLDGCQGVIASLATTTVGTAGFHLRIVNGATKNDIALAGDTTGALLSSDSTAILGSGNQVRYNGTNFTQTLALLNDATIAAPADGQTLVYSIALGKWQNAAAGGSTFYSGVFGDGSDGAVTFDGSTTILGLVPAANVYTLTRDIDCSAITINSGVTVKTNGYRVFCTGTLTNNGTISCDGNAGTATTGGGTAVNGTINTTNAGGAGGTTGTGTAGQAGGHAVGNAGAGGNGSSTNGGAAGGTLGGVTWPYRQPQALLAALSSVISPKAAPGGGGGGGDNTNRGGGGGSGGGLVMIFAHAVVNGATGTISARGGDGFTPVTGNCGGGGAGGGGAIVIYTTSAWTNSGTTNVAHGTAGNGVGTGGVGGSGSNGNVANFVLQ